MYLVGFDRLKLRCMLVSISINRGLLVESGSMQVMRSVPPRGSGWVRTSRDAHRLPTRYREVVLTCSIRRVNSGDNGLHIYVSDNCYVLLKTLNILLFCASYQSNSRYGGCQLTDPVPLTLVQ